MSKERTLACVLPARRSVTLLDEITWPAFLWEYLTLLRCGSTLALSPASPASHPARARGAWPRSPGAYPTRVSGGHEKWTYKAANSRRSRRYGTGPGAALVHKNSNPYPLQHTRSSTFLNAIASIPACELQPSTQPTEGSERSLCLQLRALSLPVRRVSVPMLRAQSAAAKESEHERLKALSPPVTFKKA